MPISKFIDAVIVDTCAFHKLQYDFAGYDNSILISLKQLLFEHEICFMSSSIIKREILKHIKRDAQEKKLSINKSLGRLSRRYKELLPMIGIKNIASVIAKAEKLDIASLYTSDAEKYFSDAIMLPLVNTEIVLNKYFDSKPPFSETGNKKSEFPDAFIIESILDYAKYSDCDILVVSDDSDWKNSLEDIYNIELVDDVKEAIRYIQDLYAEANTVNIYYKLTIGETVDLLQKEFLNSAFYIGDYYAEVIDVTEAEFDVETGGISDICPLSISNSQITYSATATISACVSINMPDIDTAVYDSEEKEYVFIDYYEKEHAMEFDIYFEAKIAINDDKSVSNKGAVNIINFNNNEDILIDIDLDT